MAKLKLPFELEKPSADEYVTQASEVGYGEGSVERSLQDIDYILNGSSATTIELPSANDVRRHITSEGIWSSQSTCKHQCVPCVDGDKFYLMANGVTGFDYAFLKTYDAQSVDSDIPAPAVDWATGWDTVIHARYTSSTTVTAPSDARWLYIETYEGTTDSRPSSVVKGDDIEGVLDKLEYKVDKVAGKGLSTNDFTTAYKNKVDNTATSLNTLKGEVDDINNDINGSTPVTIIPNTANNVARWISRSEGKWVGLNSGNQHQCFPCNGGDVLTLTANGLSGFYYAFLKTYDAQSVVEDTPAPEVDWATGYNATVKVSYTQTVTVTAPSDAHWLYVDASNPTNCLPSRIVNGEYTPSLEEKILAKAGALMDMSTLEQYISGGYITNQTFDLTRPNGGISLPMLVTIRSKYTGLTAPNLKFLVGNYSSTKHNIGSADGFYITQQFRIPPMIATMPSVTVRFEVPNGTNLYIEDFNVSYDMNKYPQPTGLRNNSHLGVLAYAPEQTIPAFEAAAMLGYRSCIVNPIKTSDGVWMCYHGGKAYLSPDGTKANAIAIADADFANYTYAQIRAYEVVTSDAMHTYWQGCKVPRLEEFFEICAKTGLRPAFSIHPTPNAQGWAELKAMLMKYNLLEETTIKLFSVNDANAAYAVFGDSIDAYIVITYVTTAANVTSLCTNIASATFAATKCRIGVELGDSSTYTQECIGAILSAGYYPTVETYSNNFANTDAVKAAIGYGATEFTDDILLCCNGLNW